MTPPLQHPLKRVVISTFEDLALLLTPGEDTDVQFRAPLAHAARVAFTGPRSGYLELRASDEVTAAAARNMTASDAAGPELCFDALAEIANVICGNLVPALGARDAVYRLSAPVRAHLEPLPPADAAVQLDLEHGCIDVRLVLTESAQPARS
jgi:hypothetical protein